MILRDSWVPTHDILKIIGLSEAHRPWEVLSRIELRQEKYGAQGILPWGV